MTSSGKAADTGATTAPAEAPPPSQPPVYEQARDELAQVVSTLEAGGLSLDDSLRLWERGEELARVCTRFLDGARARVDAALSRATAEEPAVASHP